MTDAYSKRTSEALNTLMVPDTSPEPLDEVSPRRDIVETPGLGTPPPVTEGGGAAAAYSEPDYSTRTFWPAQEVQSSDGIITFQYEPIQRINMQGDTGDPTPFDYDEPV